MVSRLGLSGLLSLRGRGRTVQVYYVLFYSNVWVFYKLCGEGLLGCLTDLGL